MWCTHVVSLTVELVETAVLTEQLLKVQLRQGRRLQVALEQQIKYLKSKPRQMLNNSCLFKNHLSVADLPGGTADIGYLRRKWHHKQNTIPTITTFLVHKISQHMPDQV